MQSIDEVVEVPEPLEEAVSIPLETHVSEALRDGQGTADLCEHRDICGARRRCQTWVKHECESKKAPPEKTDPHPVEASPSRETVYRSIRHRGSLPRASKRNQSSRHVREVACASDRNNFVSQ